jgi:adenylyltransferase/sulfurtransferase
MLMDESSSGNMELTPREVRERLAGENEILFVDVREKWEYETSRIEGSLLIPLREIPGSLGRLQSQREIVLFCHHGIRSLDAAAWLREQGVKDAWSMAGGIDRWSVEIDPNVPRY